MSSFADILGSIGGEKAPPPPARTSQIVSATSGHKPISATKTNLGVAASTTSSGYKGTAKQTTPGPSNGIKRKADEISTSKASTPAADTSLSSVSSPRPVVKINNALSSTSLPTSRSLTTDDNSQSLARPPNKPAATQGSYAAMLAKAKADQANKAKSSTGTIQHKPTEKAKSTMTLSERRAQAQQTSTKTRAPAPTSHNSQTKSRVDARRRSTSPVKKMPAKDIKPAKPPLHGPAKPVAPAYKGTMGRAAETSRNKPRSKSKYNEYLGTDEEDEGDDSVEDDGYGSESDMSADMEGGFHDTEMEDALALKAAKDDDARELALEAKLKREKQQRKLQQMAARRR